MSQGAGCLRVLAVLGAGCLMVLDVSGCWMSRVLDVWVLDVQMLDVQVLDVCESPRVLRWPKMALFGTKNAYYSIVSHGIVP